PRGEANGLFVDHTGRLWIAQQLGLGRVDDPASERPRFVTYTRSQGLASDDVQCLTEDRSGRLYVGTRRGLDRLDPGQGEVEHFTTDDGLPSNPVAIAFGDRTGGLWFGTPLGLARFRPQTRMPQALLAVTIRELTVGGIARPVSALGEERISGLVLGP